MSQPRIIHAGLFAGGILALAAMAGMRSVQLRVPLDAGVVDGSATRALESQYESSFPLKTVGINVWAAIDYLLFREGRPGVIVGEQDWLFSAEEFKTYPDAQAQSERHLRQISWVKERLQQRGTALAVAVVPAKADIYSEFAGGRQRSAIHAGLYARTRKAALDAGAVAPDLAAALRRCKREAAVFLRTDTHWTPFGARCAARSLADALKAAGLMPADGLRFRTVKTQKAEYAGDLLRFLPLDPYLAFLRPAVDQVGFERTEATDSVAGDLFAEAGPPATVLVGTSYSADSRWNFSGSLSEALGSDVVSYAAQGQGPFAPMLDYLRGADFQKAPPRLLIWEIPERYLPIAGRLSSQQPPAAGFEEAAGHPIHPVPETAP